MKYAGKYYYIYFIFILGNIFGGHIIFHIFSGFSYFLVFFSSAKRSAQSDVFG